MSFVFFSSFKLIGYNVEVSDHVHKLVGNLKSVAALVGHVILRSSRYNQLLDVKQGTWFLGQGSLALGKGKGATIWYKVKQWLGKKKVR